MTRELAQRYINDGFSGGERKKMEMLQLAMLKPRLAVMDETDTGLDIDALKVVGDGVNQLVGPEMGALVITHFPRVLKYIKPDFVHVFSDGRIVAEGGPELAQQARGRGLQGLHPGDGRGGGMSEKTETQVVAEIGADYKYGFHDEEDYFFKSGRGLSREVVEAISCTRTSPTGCASSG